MASQTNRNLQAKYLKSRRQSAAFSFDASHTIAMFEASLRRSPDMSAAIEAKIAQRQRLMAHI